MTSQDYQSTDLASILRTLAGQTQSQNVQPMNAIPAQGTHYSYDQGSFLGQPYPQSQHQAPYMPQADSSSYPYHIPSSQAHRPEPKATPEPVQKSKPHVDPRTISSWAPALRHVTKLVTNDEEVAKRIRKLVKSQHDHEKQWAEGREKAIKDRYKREESRSAINDVLRAVGGLVDTSAIGEDAEDEATVLANYDKKVHRACAEMVESITNELATIGIPFFAIQRSLVKDDPRGQQAERLNPESDDPSNSVVLTPDALKELQKRMLELLEDLCKE